MLSIREIQEKTIGYFQGKGVPNPKLETDLLIAHVLGLKRLELYLDIDRPLTEEHLNTLRPMVKRRAEREPLQYILGYTEFDGLKLKVDSRALIPRPETEELLEYIRERVTTPPKRILDLGTGSGALAIALAASYPEAEVWATDQSEKALALAKENAEAHFPTARIHLKQGSWWDALPAELDFNLIVANPPYLTEAEMKTAEPEVVDHEPNDALVSGADGLSDLRIILSAAKDRLNPGGLLALETGIAQHEALQQLASDASLSGEGINDMSGRPRFYFVEAPLADAQSQHGDENHPAASTRASAVPTKETTTVGAPLADAQPQHGDHVERTNPAKRLRKGRISIAGTRYFITCFTQNRNPGLETETVATSVLSALQDLHMETSIDLLAATVMPDHVHVLFRLGKRLELPQVIGKFKATTKQILSSAGLSWQDNYYDHRLRADDAAEGFAKYIFLNPYRSGLISVDEVWPWWVLNQNYQPEFIELLGDPPLPPKEWLGQAAGIDELVEEDK